MNPRTIHMHFSIVNGTASRQAVSTAAAYIAGPHLDGIGAENCLENALAYLAATGHHRKDSGRVAATLFLCRGDLPRARVWRELDQSFRTKTGAYSRKGGNRCKKGDDFRSSGAPRLALFMDASFPPELSERQKLEVGRKLAQDHVDRYGCAVEVAYHMKDGKIDHVHFLVTTREVDEDGVGKIIRDFNGIASKCEGGVRDGKKRLAGHAEWARQNFAAQLTEATGIAFDPRSFRRQERAEAPVTWITRERLEREKADGTNISIENRKRILSMRAAQAASGTAVSTSVGRSAHVRRPTVVTSAVRIAAQNVASLVASPIAAGQRPISASPALAPKAPSLANVSDEDRAILIRKHVDDLCRAEAEEVRQEDRDRQAELTRRLAAYEATRVARERDRAVADRARHPLSPTEVVALEESPPPKIPARDEHVPAGMPEHRFGDEEDDDTEKARKERQALATSEAVSNLCHRSPNAFKMAPLEFNLLSEGTPKASVNPTRKETLKKPPQSQSADRDQAHPPAPTAKDPIQSPTSAALSPMNPATLPQAEPSLRPPSPPLVTRPPRLAPPPHTIPPPPRPAERLSTTSSAQSAFDRREIAVAIGAYILRRTRRYHYSERLAGLAGLDHDAFRHAVNEQTAALSSVSVEQIATRVGMLVAKSADPVFSSLWSQIAQKLDVPDGIARTATPHPSEVSKGTRRTNRYIDQTKIR